MGEESNPGDVSLLLIILPEMKKVAKPSKSGQTVKMSKKIYCFVSVERVQGEILLLHKVKRSQMGSYLCIASNGYPPTVSSRAILKINCKF